MPSKQVERRARLVWVVDGEPYLDEWGPNRSAADVTLAKVRELGRVEVVDEALVMAFITLASSVDADPTNAALWGQYRAAEVALRGLGADGDGDDLEAFFAGLSPTLGDTPIVEPANPRSARRARGPRAGAATDAVAATRRGRSERGAG